MAIEARALALLGTPFRLHGREPTTGLDCVGLAAAVFELDRVPTGYSVRTDDPARLLEELRRRGFRRVGDRCHGDLLLLRAGPAQLHLGIWTSGGLVHADAGMGRVVLLPREPPWPVVARFRRD